MATFPLLVPNEASIRRGSRLRVLTQSVQMAISSFALKKPLLNVPSFFLLLAIFFCSCLPSHASISYAQHCSAVVPSSPFSSLSLDTEDHVSISNGYFFRGDEILGLAPAPSSSSSSSSFRQSPISGLFSFNSRFIYHTQDPELFHLTGSLNFETKTTPTVRFTSSRRPRHQFHQYSGMMISVDFDMSGFWSKSTGKLCMIGTGSALPANGTYLKLSAVFNLNYPNNSNISTSIVTGTVESLDASDSLNHFDTISVLAYAQNNYNYTLIPRVRDMCSQIKAPINSFGFETRFSNIYIQRLLRGQFRLEYGRECSAKTTNCGPFSHNKKSPVFFPTVMTLKWISSAEVLKVHMHISFTNSSMYDHNNYLIPGKSLVGEGYWDSKKKLLCLVACPVLKAKDYSKDSLVGECTIGISFWFPSVFTIRDRSYVMGRIWSVKGKSDPGYFSTVSFRSLEERRYDYGILPAVKYNYTKVDTERKTCENARVNSLGNQKYPDENSVQDLAFSFYVVNANESMIWGSATPMSFGETFYGNSFPGAAASVSFSGKSTNSTQYLWDISYMMTCTSWNASSVTEIAAEGVYNARTGTLCMVGCKARSSREISMKEKAEDTADCQIQINIQLSPLNLDNATHVNLSIHGSRHLNGTILSTRKKSDPLYFNPLVISSNSMYTTEAVATVRRMDMEIIMVAISLTVCCIFILLQIFHVRKNQNVLPTMSIIMLVILTLGHMVPLLLNFEALFEMNREKKSVMLWSGGWLEVNEVIVRVMTMVAFLLQFYLLQLAWTARSSIEGRKGMWVAEIKALQFCLPLYFAGGLIAWFVQTRSYKLQGENQDYYSEHNHSIWEDLMSYGGLMIDGFLLPQIVLNIVLSSKDKALAPLFYVGTTAVRALPHLYDAYRASNYVPYFNFSYIYASPDGDYYSRVWDIVIPFAGVLFAVLIFLQQHFGGSFFLPQRFRKPGGYETVPVIGA